MTKVHKMADGTSRPTTHDYITEQTVTLKEYFESRLTALEDMVKRRFESQERAVSTALAANEKRLDGMNEFRNTLNDQSKTFVTKAEFIGLEALINAKLGAIEKAVQAIQISDATLAGKASQNAVLGAYGVAVIGIVLGIIKLFM